MVTMNTVIDQPGVQSLAVGIETNFAAAFERLRLVAPAAPKNGLRGGLRDNHPVDPKNIGHAVLDFLRGVQQDDGMRTRSRESAWRCQTKDAELRGV